MIRSLNMYLTLTSFKTRDGLTLPGLLYEPERKTRKVVIFLHGNGSSSVFYSTRRSNTLADVLNRSGISCFAFNNRGAHYIKGLTRKRSNRKERIDYGTAFELIKDCIHDIDGAIALLRRQGYQEFYLIGYSTGANKICVYNFYKPRNLVKGYVLLGGGDDLGIYYQALGKRKFMYFLNKSKLLSKTSKRRELIPESFEFYHPMSWQSLYDTINPDGDYNTFPFLEHFKKLKLSRKKLFRHFEAIRKPTLVVYGGEDEFCGNVSRAVNLLKQHASASSNFTFKIFDGADHSLHGYEKEFARTVVKWIRKI